MTVSEQVLRLGRYDLRGMPPDYSRFYWPPSVPISDTIEGRRYTRRNRLKVTGKRGGRHLSETPVGKQVIAEFTKPLVERLTDLDLDPPGRLADLLGALPPEDLAQAILTPLLHGVFTVWRDERKRKKGKSSTARQKKTKRSQESR